MIFTSLVFLFCFLPIALIGFAVSSRISLRAGTLWLIAMSLVFYGFWSPVLILLISASILFNYGISVAIRSAPDRTKAQSALLWLGIGADLGALIYYKYAFALLTWLEAYGIPDGASRFADVVLPLGISFFTFTQIGYLVDCKDGATKTNNFFDYVLFVTFFPHLIAGPILHNGDMMPQFADPATRGLQAKNFAPGLTLLILGMLKKSIFADPVSKSVAGGFANAASLKFGDSWVTALSYSLQLYFDFSGYSDMAVGLALMFNIRFPANFNSPYKARNIIDFWQRFHMSLTRYLNQYLYNPIALGRRRARMAKGLPMTRKALSTPRAFVGLVAYPTIATMGLAGVWHGAGLQFLLFGLMHGTYLTINHAWRMFGPKATTKERGPATRNAILVGQVGLTFLAVLVAQVVFRANSVGEAFDLLAGMIGLHGVSIHVAQAGSASIMVQVMSALGVASQNFSAVIKIILLLGVVWFLPNTQQIMARADPILGGVPNPAPRLMLWRPTIAWALIVGALAFLGIMALGGTSEFLYFQF